MSTLNVAGNIIASWCLCCAADVDALASAVWYVVLPRQGSRPPHSPHYLASPGDATNPPPQDGRTPLHAAASGGEKEAVAALIAGKARVEAQDEVRCGAYRA